MSYIFIITTKELPLSQELDPKKREPHEENSCDKKSLPQLSNPQT